MIKFLTSSPIGKLALGQLLIIILLVGLNIWHRSTISRLQTWQDQVLSAIGDAADLRDKKGNIVAAPAKDAAWHISNLGRFKNDAQLASAAARVSDLSNVIRVADVSKTISQEDLNAYQTKLAAVNSRADRLRYDLARVGGVQRSGASATTDSVGGGGATHLPRLSNAAARVDAAPSDTRLLDPAEDNAAFTIEQRRIASAQAEQLDALISHIARLSQIDLTGSQADGAETKK
jgi:hypothetical protein